VDATVENRDAGALPVSVFDENGIHFTLVGNRVDPQLAVLA
jgi:hypothetical protein